ncbi:MAG: hypothetical protein H7210_10510 [Pyrinomonadaceae bacterium]|nr:hypothetical protein [Phycisphaerales bacterium]
MPSYSAAGEAPRQTVITASYLGESTHGRTIPGPFARGMPAPQRQRVELLQRPGPCLEYGPPPAHPVIYVTGDRSQATVDKAHSLGARTLLSKPFDTGELFQAVREALEQDDREVKYVIA